MSQTINRETEKDKRQRLRKNMPRPEQVLWHYLRRKNLGVKFRRQVSIGPYVVDFYSFEKKLVIEVDGDSHFETDKAIKHDQERTKYLTSEGVRILRFYNSDVMQNTEACVKMIFEYLKKE